MTLMNLYRKFLNFTLQISETIGRTTLEFQTQSDASRSNFPNFFTNRANLG